MRLGLATAFALASFHAIGCAPAPAVVPQVPQGGDENARRTFYTQYALTDDIGAFSATWKRKDGEYQWGSLEPLAKQYPEANDVYSAAQTRGIVLGTAGAVGGAIVGFTLGYNLTAEPGNEWSDGTQIAAYATGGGIIVVTLVAGLLWHNPAEDFAETYNAALRRELGLPDAPPKAAALRTFELRPMERGLGFRF